MLPRLTCCLGRVAVIVLSLFSLFLTGSFILLLTCVPGACFNRARVIQSGAQERDVTHASALLRVYSPAGPGCSKDGYISFIWIAQCVLLTHPLDSELSFG